MLNCFGNGNSIGRMCTGSFGPHCGRAPNSMYAGNGGSGLRLKCTTGHNAVKVWLWQEGMEKLTRANVKWFSPFLDLFFYVVEDGKFWEVFPSGKKNQESYPLDEYFPTRPFSFGGETTRANYN